MIKNKKWVNKKSGKFKIGKIRNRENWENKNWGKWKTGKMKTKMETIKIWDIIILGNNKIRKIIKFIKICENYTTVNIKNRENKILGKWKGKNRLWEKCCHRNNTFKLVITILVFWNIHTINFITNYVKIILQMCKFTGIEITTLNVYFFGTFFLSSGSIYVELNSVWRYLVFSCFIRKIKSNGYIWKQSYFKLFFILTELNENVWI